MRAVVIATRAVQFEGDARPYAFVDFAAKCGDERSISENTIPPNVGFVKIAARVRACFDFMRR